MKVFSIGFAALMVFGVMANGFCQEPEAHTETTIITTEEASPVKRRLSAHLLKWQTFLTEIARQEKAALFFDVPSNRVPPASSPAKPYGAKAMRFLALATDREWKQVSGIQTFARREIDGWENVNRVIAWLRSRSPENRVALLNTGIGISGLNAKDRDTLLPSLGWDSELAMAMLDKGDAIGVGLSLQPQIEVTDAKTGKKRVYSIGSSDSIAVPKSASMSAPEPLEPTGKGELDFGGGAVLSLKEILEKASAAFALSYRCDERVSDNLYFLSGSFTQTAFDAVLEPMTTVPKAEVVKRKKKDMNAADALFSEYEEFIQEKTIDVTDLRERLGLSSSTQYDALKAQFGDKEELPAKDFVRNRTLTVSQLADKKPGLAAFLSGIGLRPSDTVTLRMGLAFKMKSEGFYNSSIGSASINGQSIGTLSPAESAIEIR